MKVPVSSPSFLGRTSVPQQRNVSFAGSTDPSPEPKLEKPPADKFSADVPSFYAGLERTYKPLKGEGNALKYALSDHPALPNALLQNYYNGNLVSACKSGNLQKVQRLLAEVSGFSEQDVIASALYEASKNGHLPVVEELLAAPCEIGNDEWAISKALIHASGNGHAPVVEKLLAAPCQIGNYEVAIRHALIQAAKTGHAPVVEKLLAAPCQIGNNGWAIRNALFLASKNDHAPVMEKLLATPCQIGNNQGAIGSTALNVALTGYRAVAQLFGAI